MTPSNLVCAILLIYGFADVTCISITVVTYTGSASGSGTDAPVYINLRGKNGNTGELRIDDSSNNFQTGTTDRFTLSVWDVGTPTSLVVRLENSFPGGRSWYLDKVEITKAGKVYLFECYKWLRKKDSLSVTLQAEECTSLPSPPTGGSWNTEPRPYIVHQTAVLKCSRSYIRSTSSDSAARITCLNTNSWTSTTATCCPVVQHCQSGKQVCSKTTNLCTNCTDNNVFYKLWNNDTECKAMCSYNGHYCWPGQCTDELTQGCTCVEDFKRVNSPSETSCQLTKSPTIQTCTTIIVGENGEQKLAMSSTSSTHCRDLMDVYGNFQPTSVRSTIFTEFTIDISAWSKPNFIHESNFGVTDVRVNLAKKDVAGNDTNSTTNNVLEDFTDSTSARQTVSNTTNTTVPSSGFNLANGQRICVQYEAQGGGYLKSKETQSGIISSAVPYTKITTMKEICYIYDIVPPQHCQQTGTCSTDPLHVSQRVTRSSNVHVEFHDWFDPVPAGGDSSGASGLETFGISVHEVDTSIVPLKVKLSNIFSRKVNHPVSSMTLNLTLDRPKLICILLEVKDIADNVRQARRFVLFDNTSFIEVDGHKDFQVYSASAATHHTWQTHHNAICLKWNDYFYNRVYLDNPFLEKIETDYHGLITGIYDQMTGRLPITGTINVYGIIRFEVFWNLVRENKDGSTIVPDIISQTSCLNLDLKDGETYNLTVKATDIADNTLSDHRILHIDRSAPNVNNIWLIKDGYKRLFVHDTTDLSEMQLYFETFDPHSGIRTIHWKFSVSDTREELTTGAISINAIEESSCPPTVGNCYCPDVGRCEIYSYVILMSKLVAVDKHEGNHNRNYFFTVTVTNHAMLSTVEHLDILVDDSPPEKGVVLEGPDDGPEIDYTSDDRLTVHWDGFIDHESGIKVYRVALARTCLDKAAFLNRTQSPEIYEFKEVPFTIKALTIAANFTGKMFTTVVALNNAVDMSDPVCSDGITRDVNPPTLHNVTLLNAQLAESLACANGSVWLLKSTLTKRQLNMTTTCTTTCTDIHSSQMLISILPSNFDLINDEYRSNFLCDSTQMLSDDTLVYLPHDSIHLTWDVKNKDSQMDDFHVGLGRTPSEASYPSLLSYHSTNKHQYYRKPHAGIGSDQTFYIFIKAANKAGLVAVTTLGPVLIDETPPLHRAKPTVNVRDNEVIVGWENDTFYDIEQEEPIHKIQIQFGHNGTVISPMLEWMSDTSSMCQENTGGCIKYPIDRLQSHDTDLGFFLVATVHVYNRAGHFSTVNTETFLVPSKYPPGHAIISDIDPTKPFSSSPDIDIHATNNTLCATWRGFKHHENLSIEFAVGTSAGADNIVPYTPVPNIQYHCETSTSIVPAIKYFVLLRASCSGGITVSSSDGVQIFPEGYLTSLLHARVGEDCLHSRPVTVVTIDNTTAYVSLSKNMSFNVGNRYAIVSSNADAVPIIKDIDGILGAKIDPTIGQYYLIVPFIENIEIKFNCNISDVIKLYKCSSSTHFPSITNVIVHWRYDSLEPPDLYYRVSVLKVEANNTLNSVSFLTKGTPEVHRGFKEILSHSMFQPGETYRVTIETCVSNECRGSVETDIFTIESSPPRGHIKLAEITHDRDACIDIHIMWESFISDSPIIVYQWAIVANVSTMKMITSWRPQQGENNEFNVNECVHLPVHSRRPMYACLRAFAESGTKEQTCYRLKLQYFQEYPSNKVFEFDMSSPAWPNVSKVIHSKAIGETSYLLHESELDVGNATSRPAGAVVYANGRNIRWCLMTHQSVPDSCEQDTGCVYEEKNNQSFVEFAPYSIELNKIYYVCAYSPKTTIEREYNPEDLDELRGCSNGFVIDDTPPSPGKVHVDNVDSYLTDLSVLLVEWTGFSDNIDAIQLGYADNIQYYSYAIGRRVGGEDIKNFTNVGLDTSVRVDNVQVQDGSSIYVTVKATDHAGLTTTAVSEELFVDTTSPTRGHLLINCGQPTHAVCSSYSISLELLEFEDAESGVEAYEIEVGSSCSFANILSIEVARRFVDIDVQTRGIFEGHTYCINVKARNRAGLWSRDFSQQFVVDTSPPTGGHVIDGTDTKQDADYQSDLSHISTHWRGFDDVQSGLHYYRAGLGTMPYFDDIEAMAYVDLKTDARWTTALTAGQRYYTTVEACNQAGLCRSVASDGIVLDNSPPTPGVVRVGSGDKHSKFLPGGSSVHIQWFGFEDPQSDIARFDACIGTAAGECDIVPFFNCLLQSNVIRTGLNLSSSQNYYATVRTFNKVALFSEQSSDYFRIDSTPPEVTLNPRFRTGRTTTSGFSSQWDRSLLTLEWEFVDSESPLTQHIVTLKTHHEGHTPIELLDVGLVNEVTLQMDHDNWLSDGDRYMVVVTSCNAAGHCSSADSLDLLIDSTPPHLGGFKPPMAWQNLNITPGEIRSEVNLTWYGFHDEESKIETYFMSVSRSYSDNELSGGIIDVESNTTSGDTSMAEQSTTITLTEPLTPDDMLILSIWARNEAGLNSSVARVSVTVLSTSSDTHDLSEMSGVLEIEKHSCDVHFCNKDCTCAVIYQPCTEVVTNATCVVIDSDDDMSSSFPGIQVVAGQRDQPVQVSASSACLAAHWQVLESGGNTTIERFEWSMGVWNQPIGEGVFDLQKQRPWNDVGKQTEIVYCLQNNKSLEHDEQYVVYLRAWYTKDISRIYTSSPVQIDLTAPAIRRGAGIKESDPTCKLDLDFIHWMTNITACWNRVFIETQSQITYFLLALGTSPMADDVYPTTNVALAETQTITQLQLHRGTRCFLTVTAYNTVGLHTSLTSDGFLVDTDRPVAGIVFNTASQIDALYQPSTTELAVSWHGFQDNDSGIRFYSVALVEKDYVDAENKTFVDVGLRTKHTFRNLSLSHGMAYVSLVKATDAAGHVSKISRSLEKMIETTPPVGLSCANFSAIDNVTILLSEQHNAIGEYSFVPDNIIQIHGTVANFKHSRAISLSFGKTVIVLPIYTSHLGTLTFEHMFISETNNMTKIGLDIDHPSNETVTLQIDDCMTITQDGSSGLKVRQTTPATFTAEMTIWDRESSIYKIQLGVGSTPGGFQVRGLSPIHALTTWSLHVTEPHGTPLYFTAIAENHAGLRSVFSSQVVVMDKTPPVFTDGPTLKMDLGDTSDSHAAMVTWTVDDLESGILICYCALGHPHSPAYLQPYTEADERDTCIFSNVSAVRGDAILTTIRCVNNVQLITEVTSNVVVLSPEGPDSTLAKLAFITTDEMSTTAHPTTIEDGNRVYVQSNTTCLQMEWDGFSDPSGIEYFEYRLSHTGGNVIPWTRTGRETSVFADGLTLQQGSRYTADVRAVNMDGLASDVTTSDVIIGSEPGLTGLRVDVRQSGTTLTLDWGNVFVKHPDFPCLYDVTVGTRAGYTDVLDTSAIAQTRVDVTVGATLESSNVNTVHYSVTCMYVTGHSKTYQNSYTLL